MTTIKQNKRFTLFALMFIIGAVFFITPLAAHASDGSHETPLIVKEVWLTGDTLHISVMDGDAVQSGTEGQTLELKLSDYAMPGDEYVSVQATDNSGRQSNTVTFKNPYFQVIAEPSADNGANGSQSESAVPNGAKPFTPDGTGTVVDNAHDGDGKEFFTVDTPDGNVFYLIVDRQRNTDNVYLLNAVTEDDLASLAKPGDGKSVSAVGTPAQPPATPTQPETPPTEPSPTPASNPAPEKNDNTGMLAFAGIAVLLIGGAAYYFKIVRPKQGGGSASDYEQDDDFGDDDEVDLDTDGEDGEEE